MLAPDSTHQNLAQLHTCIREYSFPLRRLQAETTHYMPPLLPGFQPSFIWSARRFPDYKDYTLRGDRDPAGNKDFAPHRRLVVALHPAPPRATGLATDYPFPSSGDAIQSQRPTLVLGEGRRRALVTIQQVITSLRLSSGSRPSFSDVLIIAGTGVLLALGRSSNLTVLLALMLPNNLWIYHRP